MPFRNRFQSDLDTAVADATGEDLRTIRRRGFSLVEPLNVNFDPEPDLLPPQFVDWDELDLSRNEPVVRQPLRVVVGMREISSESRILNDDSRTMVIRTHDPHEVIQSLRDRTDILLEGGPVLAGAFLRAGVVDRILAYVAPILLGGPISAVDDVGVTSIARALRWRFDGVEQVGPDLLVSLIPL